MAIETKRATIKYSINKDKISNDSQSRRWMSITPNFMTASRLDINLTTQLVLSKLKFLFCMYLTFKAVDVSVIVSEF